MRNLRKTAVIAVALAFLAQSASAFSGALLKGVEIDSAGNRGYQVTIKTDKDVPIKKYITAANQVVLDLQNIRPAQYVSTVYNGATEVDSVVIQPAFGNKMRIFLKGFNMASSKVLLDSRDEAISFLNRQPLTVIKENKPVITPEFPQKVENIEKTEFQPIVIDLSNEKASAIAASAPIKKVKSVTPILSHEERSVSNLQEPLNTTIFDWILRALMIAVVVFAGFAFFRKPKNVEIKLSSDDMKSREMELHKSVESQKELLTRSLGMPVKESAAKKPSYNSIAQRGIKEYQNSQRPPQHLTPPTPMKSKFTSNARAAAPVAKNAKKVQNPRPTGATRVVGKQVAQAQKNFDSTKFLETMASIYQKSGRDDLATGIRQKMAKDQKAS